MLRSLALAAPIDHYLQLFEIEQPYPKRPEWVVHRCRLPEVMITVEPSSSNMVALEVSRNEDYNFQWWVNYKGESLLKSEWTETFEEAVLESLLYAFKCKPEELPALCQEMLDLKALSALKGPSCAETTQH